MSRKVMAALLATVVALGGFGLSASAAVQGPVDDKFTIPVPKAQRKIAVDEEKAFDGTALKVKLLAAERGSVSVSANGGPARTLDQSKLVLVPLDADTVCTLVFLGLSGAKATIGARCDAATPELLAAAQAQANEVAKPLVPPLQLADSTPKGDIKNPFNGDPTAIAEGHQLFLANSCNGCHGGNGGGGMGPPLTNPVWVYGNDDDTLFRLVTYGSDGLQEHGYSRKGRENVVGPMPPFGEIIEDSDNLLKIIAFIHSLTPPN